MSYTNLVTNLNNYIATNYTTTPIAYDNVHFDKTNKNEFIEFKIIPSVEKQITLSSSNVLYRLWGGVAMVVNVQKDKGSKRANILADELAGLFRSKVISGIQFKTPDINVLGTADGYYKLHVYIGFYYDNIL